MFSGVVGRLGLPPRVAEDDAGDEHGEGDRHGDVGAAAIGQRAPVRRAGVGFARGGPDDADHAKDEEHAEAREHDAQPEVILRVPIAVAGRGMESKPLPWLPLTAMRICHEPVAMIHRCPV